MDTNEFDIAKAKAWLRRLRDTGFCFPSSYIVFDCETTGLKTDYDYIVQLGHLIVDDNVARAPVATILDWTRYRQTHGDMRQRLLLTEDELHTKGLTYKWNYNRLRNEGKDPVSVLRLYKKFICDKQSEGCFFLTHNGVRFDTQIVSSHFERFLGERFCFNNDRMIDTGLIEKALQLDLLPLQNEPLSRFYHRVDKTHGREILWSLERHCIPKYKLAKKHGLDLRLAHTADFDCRATHLLMEEFRQMSEESNG